MDVEHGSFTPIVMSAIGPMGRESTKFFVGLSEIISETRHQPYSLISAYFDRKEIVICINKLCLRLYMREPFISLRYEPRNVN